MKSNELLEIAELKKYYPVSNGIFRQSHRFIKSVDGVSLVVHRGRTLGLVGESGCGKSTLGKLALNLIPPTAGSVRFQGETIFDTEKNELISRERMTELRGQMQMIFQDPYASLNPRRTVGQAVEDGVRCHKIVPPADAASYAAEVLHQCGLEAGAERRYPHEFSGGQRQRVVIARALALKPAFVVCDEPTAALDVSIQSQILNLMLDLREQRELTYLFISHNFGVVRAFCDEIAVMYLGKIVEQGSAEEVASHPAHPYTKALLSAVPPAHPLEKKDALPLRGSVPSAVNIPAGCRFHTRCPYATERCGAEEPSLREVLPGHRAACHLCG
jgi:oligopeptide/dipeptide ABC transporter ATP-binding protein